MRQEAAEAAAVAHTFGHLEMVRQARDTQGGQSAGRHILVAAVVRVVLEILGL